MPCRNLVLVVCLTFLANSPAPAAKAKMESRSYPVGDVISWLIQAEVPMTVGQEKTDKKEKQGIPGEEKQLIDLIMNKVQPASWQREGGRGSMRYFPAAKVLVISQTAEVHEDISRLLDELRKQEHRQIALEVRLMSVSEAFFEQVGVDFSVNVTAQAAKESTEPQTPRKEATITAQTLSQAFLDDNQLRQLMEAAQGDRRTNIMQAPRITLLDRQVGIVDITDTQFFLTGLAVENAGGQMVYRPIQEPIKLGFQMTAQPTVSADGRFIKLALKINQTELASSTVPLIPVQIPVEGNTKGKKEAVFEMFFQQPQLSSLNIDNTVNIPDGNTVLYAGFKKLAEGRNEYGPPILSKIPYVNRLFRNVGYGVEAQSLFIMVTARIINDEPQAPKSQPVASNPQPAGFINSFQPNAVVIGLTPAGSFTPDLSIAVKSASASQIDAVVEKILKAYEAACAAGRSDEADKLARAALILDPTCFRKP